jgi:hypothetical protein
LFPVTTADSPWPFVNLRRCPGCAGAGSFNFPATTITGSNVRKGTEMPAERGANPRPEFRYQTNKKKGKTK